MRVETGTKPNQNKDIQKNVKGAHVEHGTNHMTRM